MESYEAYHCITDPPKHKFLLTVSNEESPLKLLLTAEQVKVINFLIGKKILKATIKVAPEEKWEEP